MLPALLRAITRRLYERMKMGGASSTSSENEKRPGLRCGTLIEKRFVRTSMLATFVPVTNDPDQL